MENLKIDRPTKITLLKWLRQGYIDTQELTALHAKATGDKFLSMEEAREFLKHLEETY